MSADDYEATRAIRLQRSDAARVRRGKAYAAHAEAKALANAAGLDLKRHTEQHYTLSYASAWRVNVYPGNLRIENDRSRGRSPYLELPSDWNLFDVVNAAIAAIGKESNGRDANTVDGDAAG